MKRFPTALASAAISLAVLGGGGFLAYRNAAAPGRYDTLAQCLTDKGVKLYGTYWCSHCQNQKKTFGKSFQKINYVECAAAGTQGQTKECTDAGVTGYPTWIFPDGTQLQGEQTPQYLAEKAGCEIPQ